MSMHALDHSVDDLRVEHVGQDRVRDLRGLLQWADGRDALIVRDHPAGLPAGRGTTHPRPAALAVRFSPTGEATLRTHADSDRTTVQLSHLRSWAAWRRPDGVGITVETIDRRVTVVVHAGAAGAKAALVAVGAAGA